MQPDPIKTSDARQAAVPGGEPDAPDRRGQRAAILKTLLDANGEWVSAASLVSASCQYSARIHELRHQDGYQIENRVEHRAGRKLGFFRLKKYVTVSDGKLVATPARVTPEPERSREQDAAEIAPPLFPELVQARHRDEG